MFSFLIMLSHKQHIKRQQQQQWHLLVNIWVVHTIKYIRHNFYYGFFCSVWLNLVNLEAFANIFFFCLFQLKKEMYN